MACSWSAARRHHRAASVWSCRTPVPSAYIAPGWTARRRSLVGGEAVQPGCLGVVLRDLGVLMVQPPEVGLPAGDGTT